MGGCLMNNNTVDFVFFFFLDARFLLKW